MIHSQGIPGRLLAVFLSLLLLAGLLPASPAFAEEQSIQTQLDEPEDGISTEHLTVANTTRMTGRFFLDSWGNVTSDTDVRSLIHDYNLVMWDRDNAMFDINPTVVSGVAGYQSANGDLTFILALYRDLKYSDGSPITAWDYAFSILLAVSPEIGQIGRADIRRWYAGYDAYASGRAPYLAGVRVTGDYMLRITLNHEYLPFFYEMGLLDCQPYPIGEIAPGVVVKDDGQGVYLANADSSVTEPVFTAELLKKTILDPDTGYASHPKVTSGPYMLTSFDGTTAEFTVNPFFKADEHGRTPTVRTLTYTLGSNETWMDQLTRGEVDILNKVTREDVILAGTTQVYNGVIRMGNYPRSGLSRICFACERPTVSSISVRQAIAWCTARESIVQGYTGGFGQRVDGYYGVGQWMYQTLVNGLPSEETAAPDAEAEGSASGDDSASAGDSSSGAVSVDSVHNQVVFDLTDYEVDVRHANVLLASDGWVRNEDGLREKDGVVLDLKLMYPEGSPMGPLLERHMVPYLLQAGIRLTLVPAPMSRVFEEYYKEENREMDMILMATNFTPLSELSAYQEDDQGRHLWSYTKCEDEELYNLSVALRKTTPGDVAGYLQNWAAFQTRYNECLPAIPLYSNFYFDFYRRDLRNYDVSANVYWTEAILGASLEKESETGEEEEILFSD